MRMFTFSVNTDSRDVLRRGLLDKLESNNEITKAWLGEIFITAADKAYKESICVDSYAFKCEQNTQLTKQKNESPLISVEEINEGKKGIADTVAFYVDSNIDAIIEDSEVKSLVEEFLDIHEYLLIEEGTDLWHVIKRAKTFNTAMVDKLRRLTEKYRLDDLIKGILSRAECSYYIEGALAAC
ncbi:hypothetical protein D3C81_09200 [compost metagenome]